MKLSKNTFFSVLTVLSLMFVSCSNQMEAPQQLSTDVSQGQGYLKSTVSGAFYTQLPTTTFLYVIDKSVMSLEEYQMLTSLQGLLAQSASRIYITDVNNRASYTYWIQMMESNYGVTTQTRTDAMGLLNEFKSQVSGYVLTTGGGVPGGWGTADTNGATSLAGINNAIVVCEALESAVQSLGLNMVIDARNLNLETVFDNNKHLFNNNAVFTQNYNIMQLRDYSIATQGFIFHSSNQTFINKVYDWVADDRPQFGWGWAFAGADEEAYVGNASKKGVFTNPSDWVMNLSALAAVGKNTLSQRPMGAIDSSPEAHYLSINLSDGDNYSFVLQGMCDEGKYFDNPNVGQFATNYTFPASMIELAPSAMEWYYSNATANEYFVAGASGVGYMFPSEYPFLSQHLEGFNEFCHRSDLPYIGILDHPDIGSPGFLQIAQQYASQPNIKGAYYVNYDVYNRGAGQIEFVNGKPFVALRENMWEMTNTDIQNLATRINNYSRDPSSPDAYTIMNVHAWSHTMDDVAYLVSLLDAHVKVVNMDEFFEQLTTKVSVDNGIVSGKTYKIVSKNSGKCLSVYGASTYDGGNIVQWDDAGSDDQKWKVEDVGDGYYKLTAQHSNKVIAVDGGSIVDGANVMQWTSVGSEDQKWSITSVGGGYNKVEAKHSGKCLDVANWSVDNGGNVQQWTYGGGTNQQWKFIEVVGGGTAE